ncbi:hypothetical protein M2366_002296 [Aeromonas sp. BIGb0405]|uniref:hypothetical protein n=1 Tax=Aeromonas sp. BIGb0405 TaxID=2940592 RepID=UPI002168E646|nr:hypothetical protein [Aeromonas sp. BIGb0405]MCS3456210.1 hypothetical protein [Aeromonas sp. BIGb0405]
MKAILLRWLARYDAWSQRWGLSPEYRRCCTPQRREARADCPKPVPVEKQSAP